MTKLMHGQIVGGLSVVPNLQKAIYDYRDILGLKLLEEGIVSQSLADGWGVPNVAGQSMATLQPHSGAHCALRLVEQPDHPNFIPTTSYGWAAFELTVQDVFGWPDRLQGSGFDIVGPPREIPGLPYFIPMQVHGTGREMVYLNEVREDTPSSDLPKANSITDHIFITILATPNRGETVDWYAQKLGLAEADQYTIPYSMINKAFGLPDDHLTTLSMVQSGRLPIVEVDDYPEAAQVRPRHDGMLPPGNAIVTLAIDSFDGLDLEWIAPPIARDEMPYNGARCATIIGPAGEYLELVEIG